MTNSVASSSLLSPFNAPFSSENALSSQLSLCFAVFTVCTMFTPCNMYSEYTSSIYSYHTCQGHLLIQVNEKIFLTTVAQVSCRILYTFRFPHPLLRAIVIVHYKYPFHVHLCLLCVLCTLCLSCILCVLLLLCILCILSVLLLETISKIPAALVSTIRRPHFSLRHFSHVSLTIIPRQTGELIGHGNPGSSVSFTEDGSCSLTSAGRR